MIVWAEELRAFHADGSITKGRAFGGAGNNTNVVGHDLILQRHHDLTDSCCGFATRACPLSCAGYEQEVVNDARALRHSGRANESS